MRHFAIAVLIAAVLAITPSVASADATFTGSQALPQGRLAVSLKVNRFIASAAGTQAAATAKATLTPLGQLPTSVTKQVRLAVSRSGACTILTLTLDTLDLKLLGLDVHLDKVVLNVTGQPHGGVLGSLFCSLARAHVKAARASAVSRMNAAIRRNGGVRPLALTAAVRATTSAVGPTCSVLDLVLGPLHLNLLGLVVDLNQVHLAVVADPAGGVLGGLFCGLANTKIP